MLMYFLGLHNVWWRVTRGNLWEKNVVQNDFLNPVDILGFVVKYYQVAWKKFLQKWDFCSRNVMLSILLDVMNF